jgi:hypothetical protein
MKMRNYEVEGFIGFLMGQELSGKKSRARTKFAKLATEHMKEVEEGRMQLIKEYSNLDENGQPKTIEKENGQSSYDIKDMTAFVKEYDVLMNENFIIEETESNKEMLEIVKDAVLETEQTFKGSDALVYERYCEIVEGN